MKRFHFSFSSFWKGGLMGFMFLAICYFTPIAYGLEELATYKLGWNPIVMPLILLGVCLISGQLVMAAAD